MLTLAETKLHLRVDHSEEDALIEALMTTATAACADYLNMDAADLVVAVPAPVKSAALLMVAGLYENREDVSDRQLYRNDTYYRLLNPYRQYRACTPVPWINASLSSAARVPPTIGASRCQIRGYPSSKPGHMCSH